MTWAGGWFPDAAFPADPPRRPCRSPSLVRAGGAGRSRLRVDASERPLRVRARREEWRMRAVFPRAVSGDDRSDARAAADPLSQEAARVLDPPRPLELEEPFPETTDRGRPSSRATARSPAPTPTDRCVRRERARRHVDRRPPGARPVGWVRAHAPHAGTPSAVLPSSTSLEAIEAGSETCGDARFESLRTRSSRDGSARRASTRTSDLRD